MRKIIDNKIYNTETSTEIVEIYHGQDSSDLNHYQETLYMTKNGRLFLYKTGGPNSSMGKPVGNNGMSGSSDIIDLTRADAIEWAFDAHKINDLNAADIEAFREALDMDEFEEA